MNNYKRVYLKTLINEIFEMLEKEYNIDSDCEVYHTIDKVTKDRHFDFLNQKSKYRLSIERYLTLFIKISKIEKSLDKDFSPFETGFSYSELYIKEVTKVINKDFYQAIVLLENEIFKKFPKAIEY